MYNPLVVSFTGNGEPQVPFVEVEREQAALSLNGQPLVFVIFFVIRVCAKFSL